MHKVSSKGVATLPPMTFRRKVSITLSLGSDFVFRSGMGEMEGGQASANSCQAPWGVRGRQNARQYWRFARKIIGIDRVANPVSLKDTGRVARGTLFVNARVIALRWAKVAVCKRAGREHDALEDDGRVYHPDFEGVVAG